MLKETSRHMVHGYFHHFLGLHDSVDFRGCLYVPDEFRFQKMDMDHVAIAVAYNAFVGKTCCIHSVIHRPDLVSRSIVRETFEYPFITCGCEAVIGLVDSTNDAALNFNKKLGFKEVHRIPNGGPDGDMIIMQMLRSDCRWLRKTH